MKIQDTVAVITGGASGLGEASARHLLQLGAQGVVLVDLNKDRGEKLAAELGERAMFIAVDITDAAAVDAGIAKAVARFGRVTAMLASAGITGPAKLLGSKGPIALEKFDQVVKVNLYGTLHVIRAMAAAMVKNEPDANGERGVLINVSSGAAFEGQVGQIAYAASKAALVGMTLPLARELGAHGIRVLTIAPGGFETPIYEQMAPDVKAKLLEQMQQFVPFPKRLGRPGEFAPFVAELITNVLHNGRTYRFDSGGMLPTGM